MAARQRSLSVNHPVILTFLIFAIIGFMYFAAEVLKPLALAVLLSFALSPLVRFLERRGLRRAPAVILTVVFALGTLGGIGFLVGRELSGLAQNLPGYEKAIRTKIHQVPFFSSSQPSISEKVAKTAENIESDLTGPIEEKKVLPVAIVSRPTFQERLRTKVGPVLEPVAIGFFVLILVLFMLMNREDLSDRLIQLFGSNRISLTTRTMDEVGYRIGRYLAMFATVNSTFGLIVGLGLWAIGVPYPALWGFLAAVLRFIPYIGPATAFALPFIFAIADPSAIGWTEPLMVLGLFGVMEVLANSFLEPVIYGKTTGVSALGLLVAAMFWTWLWGPLGLLLSTPLTVCLAVLGKYVPALRAFGTLLGEDAELEQDVRYYQRLLALDQDGATEIVETALKQMPRAAVFDTILIPALSRAERDYAREEIDDREQAFAWRVTGDIVDELEGTPDVLPTSLTSLATDGAAGAGPVRLLGVAANDTADALVLRMLAQLLTPIGCAMEIITDAPSPMKLAERVDEESPRIVILSHLPPVGLTPARYMVKRLRARFTDLPIWVGRWGESGSADAADRLTQVGATRVVFGLSDARDQIAQAVMSKPEPAVSRK